MGGKEVGWIQGGGRGGSGGGNSGGGGHLKSKND